MDLQEGRYQGLHLGLTVSERVIQEAGNPRAWGVGRAPQPKMCGAQWQGSPQKPKSP